MTASTETYEFPAPQECDRDETAKADDGAGLAGGLPVPFSSSSVVAVSDKLTPPDTSDADPLADSDDLLHVVESLADEENRLEAAELAEHGYPEGDQESLKLERKGITSQNTQTELWHRELHWAESIVSKLDTVDRPDLADKIRHCHTEKTIIECCGCHKRTIVFNRCDVGWCPICAPRLAFRRKERVGWWAALIKQPKHVVLTVKNFPRLTRQSVKLFKDCFSKLRRRQFASNWQGGFYSLEVTNEGEGWHLHLHALIDARWIDAGKLSQEWAKIVGQDFAIVKVKDCRAGDYLREVTKYAVKGSTLAGWTGEQIADFVRAFDGVRTFGVFGSLYGQQKQWREWLEESDRENRKCECGCDRFVVLSENEVEWREILSGSSPPRHMPELSDPQPLLLAAEPAGHWHQEKTRHFN